MNRHVLMSTLCLIGCAEPGPGLPDRPPFPSFAYMADGHVALPADLPHAATPVPVERLGWRTGFSPVQTAVVSFRDRIDAASLPGLGSAPTGGSVQLWDLTDGAPVPCFAELDAWPEGDTVPALLIRPLRPVPVGHRVAAVITDRVRTEAGAALPVEGWFEAAVQGRPGPGLEDVAQDLAGLVDALKDLGVQDELVLAFDWPVSDGTAPLLSMLDSLATPSSWTFDRSEDADDGASLPPGIWRRELGRFTTDNWLVDDGQFALDADGMPMPQGTVDVPVEVYVPDSVRDAAPGSVPVWIFGHGIFSKPGNYLADGDDPSAVAELADRAGAIVVATVWRGLTQGWPGDLVVSVDVGSDFGRMPDLTDKLAQGVANTVALSRAMLDGDLLSDPVFGGLADGDALRYYGISLGGIEGAVVMATQPDLPHGVLHVGGSTWSTMLERSQHWELFETLLVGSGIDDPRDRQLLYSVSQLMWDPVDPALYAEALRDRSVLWQVAVGDDQVPNVTTFTLAGAVGAKVLTPVATVPEGFATMASDGRGPAMSLFDPQMGNDDASNRPASDSEAHETPRLWEGTKLQTLRFLEVDDPGVVAHFCGPTPCSPQATGD